MAAAVLQRMKLKLCCLHPKVRDERDADLVLRVTRHDAPQGAQPALQVARPAGSQATPAPPACPDVISSVPHRASVSPLPVASPSTPTHRRAASDVSAASARPPALPTIREMHSAPGRMRATVTLPEALREATPAWSPMPELGDAQGAALATLLESRPVQRSLKACTALDLTGRGLTDDTLPRVAVVLATEAPQLKALSLRRNRFSDIAINLLHGLHLDYLDLRGCGLVGTCQPLLREAVPTLLMFSDSVQRAARR